MTAIRHFTRFAIVVALVPWLAHGQAGLAAENAGDKQAALIQVLKSDAPLGDKAIACKRLAIYGNKEAVPALAPLLANDQLSSWARIPLEAIPDPAADDALRAALDQVQGRLLVGVINSLGVRKDARSVSALVAKMKAPDAEVASAAAEALGHIGGPAAAKSLTQALAGAPEAVRSSVAEGCVVCASQYLAGGKPAEAQRLYDTVRAANVPKQRVLEAIRGAILARGSKGIPLLLEQLRSTDKGHLGIGLRTARELPGRDVTAALAAELDRCAPERQVLLLLAAGDRGDATIVPKVLQLAQGGSPAVRVAAVALVERLGDLSNVPVLLKAAAADDAELARTAKSALIRMEGKPVDADLLGRLPQATGKTRQVLIELAGRRQLTGAVPEIMRSIEAPDAELRQAALASLSTLGNEAQAGDLVRLLLKAQPADRDEVEKSLTTICSRCSARCLPYVLPLAKNADVSIRKTALHALSAIGGPEALAGVTTAVNDQDETVQDEAVKMLCTWPNAWPEDAGVAEPLLTLAKTGKKPSYQVQGLRGYLQFMQETKKLDDEAKLARLNDAVPLITRPDDKRLAVSVVSTVSAAGTLELLTRFAQDGDVAEEACQAIVRIAAGQNAPGSKEARQKALQTVVNKTKNDATRKQAEDALKRLQP